MRNVLECIVINHAQSVDCRITNIDHLAAQQRHHQFVQSNWRW